MPAAPTLISERDFVALTLDRPPTLIDPWLAPGSITLLFGPPSAGKTMVTLSTARALATGATLWDAFPCVKSRVLIVQADMATVGYHERLKASAASASDQIQLLLTDGAMFDVLRAKPTDAHIAAAREFAPAVVFVDTLRKTHLLDENESLAADRVYDAWRHLFPGAALVFLHHARKIPTQVSAHDVVVREAFRGNTAWAASADTLLMLRRVRKQGEPGWLARLSFVRTRGCEEPAPLLLTLTENLLLEPAPSAVGDMLATWFRQHPTAPKSDAVHMLMALVDDEGEPRFSRATAYRMVTTFGGKRSSQMASHGGSETVRRETP